MFEFRKQILEKVSFDKFLFKKELAKAIKSIKGDEILQLKIWCITTFTHYRKLIAGVFKTVAYQQTMYMYKKYQAY